MPQDLLAFSNDDIKKMLAQAMGDIKSLEGGGLPADDAGPGQSKVPVMDSFFSDETYNPPESFTAGYLENTLGWTPAGEGTKKPRAMRAPTLPGEKPAIDTAPVSITPPAAAAPSLGDDGMDKDYLWRQNMLKRGMFAAKEPPAKPQSLEEQLAGGAPAAPDRFSMQDLVAENLKTVGEFTHFHGVLDNPAVNLAHGVGYSLIQIGGAFLGAIATTGKEIFNVVSGNGKGMPEAEEWGNKIVAAATSWAAPQTEGGKAVAAGIALPFELALGAWDGIGKKISTDPEFQASWRWVGNVTMLAVPTMRKAGKGMVRGKAELPVLTKDLSRRFQKEYAKRTKEGTPPTVAETREIAKQVGIPQEVIDLSDRMLENWENAGAETPEGRLGPTEMERRPISVRTQDGTTVTVQPGDRSVMPRVKGQTIETPEGTIGMEMELEPKKAPAPAPAKPPVPPAATKAAPKERFPLAKKAIDDWAKEEVEIQAAKLLEKEEGIPVEDTLKKLREPETTKYPWEEAETPKEVGTFSREQAFNILQQVEKAGGKEGLDNLAASFGIDATKMTARQTFAAVGPELMKVEKRKSAIQDIFQREREFVEREPQGFEDVPPPDYTAEPKAPGKAPARPVEARTPAPPAKETGKAEKVAPEPSRPAKPASSADVRAATEAESLRYDREHPAPRDSAGRARWERDKAGFLSRVVAARMRQKTVNPGFFGGGEIQALWEAFQEARNERGPKGDRARRAGSLAHLMEEYNKLSGLALMRDPEKGWDAYRAADARVQLGPLEGAIRKTWQEMNQGLGRVATTVRAKTQEGRDAQARIAELNGRLDEIDATYDRITRGEPEMITTKKAIGPGEAAAYKAAGIPVELTGPGGKYGGFIDQVSRRAERAMTTEDQSRAIRDLNNERAGVVKELIAEENKVGELEVVHELGTDKRPVPFEEPHEPIAREKAKSGLTKAEQKFYEGLYTEQDWLERAATETRKKARTAVEKAIITPERLGHQRIFSQLSLVEENIRRARAQKTPIRPDQIMGGFPHDHALYQPILNSLKEGDLARTQRLIDNARNRLFDYSAKEGAPYAEPPMAMGEIEPLKAEPTIVVPEGRAGVLKDKTGKTVPAFRPPAKETGPVQYTNEAFRKPQTQAENQRQWAKSMRDLRREDHPGLPGHFSKADQFPRIYPEPSADAPGGVIARANRINDLSVEVIDRVISEGLRDRVRRERLNLPSEGEGLSAQELADRGGMTIEDAVRGKKADAWVKIINRMNKDRTSGQLGQITDVVEEHLARSYETHEAMVQAIMSDVRDLPVSKMIFRYTTRIKGMVSESLPNKAAPVASWQIEQAIFDAYSDRLLGGEEGGFVENMAKNLERMGTKEEFTRSGGELNHLAMKILAKKIWDEKYLNDYAQGIPAKKRAVQLMLQEGVSAPVAKSLLEAEGYRVPSKPERVAAWAGGKDRATGQLTGYFRYIAEKANEWAPEAKREFDRLSRPIVEAQGMAGGAVESPGKIARMYFDPILRRLDEAAGRLTPREKVTRTLEDRAAAKEAKAVEADRLAQEAAEQESKIAANPEAYNLVEVEPSEPRGPYPWEDEGGSGGGSPEGGGHYLGFLGGGSMQQLYEAMGRGIRKFMRDMAETRREKAGRLDREARVYKSEDPEVARRYDEAYRARRREGESKAQEFKHSLTRIYQHLPNTPQFQRLTNSLKWLEKEYARAYNETMDVYSGKILRDIDQETSRLTRRRLEDTFEKKVFYADVQEMYDGGANEFPQGLTRESVPREIANFNRYLSELTAPEREAVNTAFEARKAAFRQLADQIIAEGREAGYDLSDIFSRKDYYRHEVLTYYDRAVRGGRKMKPSTYSWGMRRKAEGHAGDIATDVRGVDGEIMGRLIYERDRLRVHNTIDRDYNIYDQIEQQAAARGIPMKEALKTLVPEGYQVYYFDKNHLIFNAMTVSERLANKILHGSIEEIMREVTSKDPQSLIHERMAIGPKRKPWIVPEELARTLDDFAAPRPEAAWWQKGPATLQGYWKGYKLLGPKRILKFQFRNLTGDAEMHAIGNPSTFTKVPRAVKMLDDHFRKGITSPEMKEWIDFGGMDTTFHWAEVGDFQRLWKFSEKMGDQPGAVAGGLDAFKKAWNSYADWAKKSSDMREGTLRLASYLDYREQMTKNVERGRGEVPNNWGASRRELIQSLPDIPTKAFWLSNELSGAYDLVSPAGRFARQGPVPFWSWKEITAKRYYRMFQNARIDGMTARQIGGQFVRGAPYAALKVGAFVLKANALMAIWQAINHHAPALVGDPEAEEKLPKDVQKKPHFTFGGGHYFSQIGSASDILDFFGLDIPSEMVVDFIKAAGRGEKPDLGEIARKWWKDQPMVNHIFQSLTPFIKIPMDILYGRKTYPDLMNPRGIRDPFEYLADQMDVGSEYRLFFDRPGKEPAGKYLAKLFDYQHEENETAYFDWIGYVNDFRKSRGTNTVGYSVTQKSNYLYWFKRARAEGDMESAQKFFKKFVSASAIEAGYKGKDPDVVAKGIVQSIRQSYKEMFPLAKLTPLELSDLAKTMSPNDKKMLARAVAYWRDILVGKEDAPGITAEIEEDNQEE